MGDWDGWTRGQELSAEDHTSDSVYARFEGAVTLRPGRYRVKLMVRPGARRGGGGGAARFEGAVTLRPWRYQVKLMVRAGPGRGRRGA
jgi:hypothetical protein